MPTGYTSDIYEGKSTSLRDLVIRCAHGMGFMVLLRDDGIHCEVPRRFEVDPYHQGRIQEAKGRLDYLKGLDSHAARTQALLEYNQKLRKRQQALAKNDRLRADYQELIEQAERWEVPEQMDGLKKLVLDQLHESLKFDVHDMTSPNSYWEAPVLLSWSRWLEKEKQKAQENIAYHTEGYEEEKARTQERNDYLDAFWASLPEEG